jgi:hypothetical protein
MDTSRALLRHTVATLAYRAAKVLRDTPPGFGAYRASADTRSAGEIVAHIGDLFDWGWHLANGTQVWNSSAPLPWEAETARFYATLGRFDARLASDEPLGTSIEQLFQGPVADALAHVGQLALLRRLAGAPIRGENYQIADIAAGQVGPAQPTPKFEFD